MNGRERERERERERDRKCVGRIEGREPNVIVTVSGGGGAREGRERGGGGDGRSRGGGRWLGLYAEGWEWLGAASVCVGACVGGMGGRF